MARLRIDVNGESITVDKDGILSVEEFYEMSRSASNLLFGEKETKKVFKDERNS